MSTPSYFLHREQLIERPLEDVFGFFAEAANLEAITPDYLNFRIVTPRPIEMCEGALIDYRLQLFGVPFGWRTMIEQWIPNRRFVDTQVRGPYALWRHEHDFEETEGGVLVQDRVEYRLPLWFLGSIAHKLMVKQTLEDIFDHRQRKTAELLEGATAAGMAC